MAKKELESGRLYLRIEEYSSALIYFNLVLSDYYDTVYYDEAIFNIILTYILKKDFENAKVFFETYKMNLLSDIKLSECESLIQEGENGITLKNRIKLLK